MYRRIAALLLCALLTFQLAAPPAGAADYLCFVAAGENILPLSADTMPFWSDGYLYVSSAIFTGTARDALGIGRVRNNPGKRVILYKGGRSLWFEWEKSYAYDQESGEIYFPGAIYRGGEVYVPISVVAWFFGLQYTVTKITAQAGGESAQGELAWIRQPGHVLTERVFANAASSQITNRYLNYLKEQEEGPADSEDPGLELEEEGVEIEGRSIYLCLAAGGETPAMLDALDRSGAQAAFFCTGEFLESQGGLLRRMIATGQGIGILVDAADAERTVAEQLEAGNRALARATCGKSRLAYIQNADETALQAAREAGYRCLEPDLDRSAYSLRSGAGADSLLRQVSARRENVSVWLAGTAGAEGLQMFLEAAENADGRCLAWTETA